MLQSESLNAQTPTTGIIKSLESLLKIHKKQYKEVFSQAQKNPTFLSDRQKINLTVNPFFMKSLLLHTNDSYLSLALKNECRFLSLIDSGLIKTALGFSNHIIVDIATKNMTKTALVGKRNYLDYMYSKKCFHNKDIITLFNKKNIVKTVKSLSFPIPETYKECLKIHTNWITNSYLPYLCSIPESIRQGRTALQKLRGQITRSTQKAATFKKHHEKGKFLKKEIPYFQQNYLTTLCSSLDKPQNFCSQYLANNVWVKSRFGEQPLFKSAYKCQRILKKQTLSKNDIKKCTEKLNKKPGLCTNRGTEPLSALFPMPNCSTISDALLVSRLHTDYHDCPGGVDNQALVNIHRIIAHKKKLQVSSKDYSCSSQINYSFAKLNLDKKNDKGWPLRICYFDTILDKKICDHYVPGHSKDSSLDERHIVAKILYRLHGSKDQTPCKIVDQKNYNPHRLKYKSGCFIIIESKICTPFHCRKRIVYNTKEIKGLEYIGIPIFDYFPTAFSNEKFSADNLLLDSLKLEKKIIHNLTTLNVFMNQFPEGIIHGVGCAGDLLPSFFKKESFNRCRPLPFIIDGITEKNGTSYLTFRSALDDLHSPRLISWNHLFNGISNYREFHPLKTWTFYGIK